MTDPNALRDVVATLPYGSCPVDGVAAAGQPDARMLTELARAGYRTVLDLRAPGEPRGFDEAAAVTRAGMHYVPLPVTQATLTDAVFDRFRAVMRDPDNRPILVHCASSNRVGALLMPYFILDEHRSAPDALTMARAAGLRSPELAEIARDYAERHARAGS
jgi:protein tyrosine phosphatase (PTP) superfamily phosphohydrolase (DUF442 family)